MLDLIASAPDIPGKWTKLLEDSFTGDVSVWYMLLSLALAFLMGLFIVFVYKITFRGVLFSKSFAFSLILLTVVTAVVIRTISTNLALSLGMVGALSIVRFRTAVKDPADTIFMFWCLASGIMAGAGLYIVAPIVCLCVGIFYVLVMMLYKKNKSPYLLVLRYDPQAYPNVQKALRMLPKYRIKSRTVTRAGAELTLEVALATDEMATIDKFMTVEGVLDASLVSYDSEFGL